MAKEELASKSMAPWVQTVRAAWLLMTQPGITDVQHERLTRQQQRRAVREGYTTTDVKVAMTASPDTTYHVFLKCVRQIGDVTTGDEGTGIDTFSFPTNIVGNVFAFDVYPEGAPLGNKFQSVQVVFK